ncbi:DUF4256 domain-containing protein [Dyadobacter luteus]|uniref:DUF4256 domain-containing protein n=1 Tax=Dyadobacter luteus TaxID=2259619 RepID=A0A3D8YC22_9BACT|nr:DUF4256 domain-containing protein [Dyadobacter luteus]REA61970.1 DUF4256 domain-containing protein [Dyadobacter luteus]
MSKNKKELPADVKEELLQTLKARFEKNINRHKDIQWSKVMERLEASPAKLWSLSEMEVTGGEPDVVDSDSKTGEFIFFDCSPETPKERRSLCYDRQALDARKANKPVNSAMDMAEELGIEMLDEEEYKILQQLGSFDLKTSSWLKTTADVRKLGGAIFGDRRFNRVFIYHNGADSYYAARGFRGSLRV